MKICKIMRGLPGSGKSYLANQLSKEDDSIVLSTDNFFMKNGEYHFNPKELGVAHKWNQQQVEESMKNGRTLIIIDNTNTQAWEAREYVKLALKYDYVIAFVEVNTWWAKDVNECAKRNTHNVPINSIKAMLNRWEENLTVSMCLESKAPWEK
jgi:NEDD4-binding protein 2